MALLDRLVGDGVHEVAEGDARLHGAAEAHQHGLGHVQGHHARRRAEGNEAGAGGEGDADGEAGVGVAAGADGVGQQHAVQPGVDDAVAGLQGHAAAVADEVRQRVVGGHVHRLGVGGGVAEGLHDEVGGEAEAGEILELVAGHGPGGVLGAHGSHLGLAVRAGEHAVHAARLADHLLREGEALAGGGGGGGLAEHLGGGQPQGGAGLVRQAAPDDQGNAPAGAHLVKQHLRLEGELRDDVVGAMAGRLALVRENVNHVAHGHVPDGHLNGEGAGVLHGVEEDGRDLLADAHAAGALVGHVGDVVAHVPQDGVGGGLAAGAGAHHIAHVSQREPLRLQLLNLLVAVVDAVAGVLEHGEGVEGDVGAGPGVGRGREVVRVGLARHLEHRHRDLLRHVRLRQEPLRVRPRLHHLLGGGVATLGLGLDVVEGVEHQEAVLELLGSDGRQLGVVQGVDQGLDVVSTLHGPKELDSLLGGKERRLSRALGHRGQKASLDVRGVIHAGGDAGGQQLLDEILLTCRRGLSKLHKLSHLLRVERLRHDPLRLTLIDVLVVRLREGGHGAGLSPHEATEQRRGTRQVDSPTHHRGGRGGGECPPRRRSELPPGGTVAQREGCELALAGGGHPAA
mmetsp:Transcript_29766/g.65014  ORF Transcript_29766/g.65014 Transcript_29766/m.65014 type:complete len:625 (-) Transcript_29766:76-1950(-)